MFRNLGSITKILIDALTLAMRKRVKTFVDDLCNKERKRGGDVSPLFKVTLRIQSHPKLESEAKKYPLLKIRKTLSFIDNYEKKVFIIHAEKL